MIDYYETKSQPVTKVMVWQAYKAVKAKRGSGGMDNMSLEDLEKVLRRIRAVIVKKNDRSRTDADQRM